MSVVQTERPLTAPALTGLRVLPAPCSEPPYDDERPGGRPLPLRPATLRPAPLRLVPPLDDAPTRTPSSDLPSPKPFAQALVQRLLEVLAGVRPLSQLQRDMAWETYDALEALLTATPRTHGPRPDRRAVRSVRVQDRGDGVAEGFATVRRGSRYGAFAFRLEGVDGQWRCTELEGV